MAPLYAARVHDLGPGDLVERRAVGVTASYTQRRHGARPLAWNKDRDTAACLICRSNAHFKSGGSVQTYIRFLINYIPNYQCGALP